MFFVRRQLLAVFAIALIFCTIAAGVYFDAKSASAATNGTINFQARLMSNTGAIAPDGDYNVEFKIYNTLSSGGTAQGVCTGACQWVETRISTDKIHVANGYLTANLGSVTAFGSTIKWDQDLWITMNIGGTGTPTWDGEMSPRLKLTAVPYAFRAAKLASLAGSFTGVLQFAGSFAQDSVITLPDPGAGTATVCYQNATSCGFAAGTAASYIQNTSTVQTGANFAIRSNATNAVGGVIQGASGQSVDLFDVQTWNGTTATTVLGVSNVGLVTLGAGLTETGTAQINVGGSGTTSINTGGNTGTIGIGNASAGALTIASGAASTLTIGNTLSISSNNFSVSATGTATLGLSTTNTGAITFKGSGNSNTLTLQGPNSPAAGNFTLSIPAITGNANVCTDNSVCTGYAATPASGSYIQQVPTGTVNVIQPTASGVIALTVNGTSNATGATALVVAQSQANDAVNVNVTNATGTVNNALLIAQSGGGTLTNGLAFSGTIGTDISRGTGALTVQGGGGVTISSTNVAGASGAILIQGGNSSGGTAGNVTVDTGTTSTGTPTVNIGNANAKAVQIGNNTSNPTITIDSGTSQINVGTGGQARTVNIGTTSGSNNVLQQFNIGTNPSAGATNTVTIGSTTATASVTTLNGGTASGTSTSGALILQAGSGGSINIGNTAATKTVNIGSTAALAGDSIINIANSSANVQTVTIGSTNSTSATTIQGGTGNINLGTNSASASIIARANTDSATAFVVQNSNAAQLLDIDTTNITNVVANGGAETSGSFTTDYTLVGTASAPTRDTTNFLSGVASASVAAGTTAGNGLRNNLASNPAVSSRYVISFAAKVVTGTSPWTDVTVNYSYNGGTNQTACTNYNTQTATSSAWTKITCYLDTPANAVTNADLLITQAGASGVARTFVIDNLSMALSNTGSTQSSQTPQIRVGGLSGQGTTVLTLDQAAAAPTTSGLSAYLGSMFYNTTTGHVQCYEAGNGTGGAWGDCGSSTLQGAYNNSAGASPSILTTSTNKAVTIQTANSGGIAAGSELFGVHLNNSGDTLGSSIFSVNSTTVGINMGAAVLTSAFSYDLTFGSGSTRTIGVQAPTGNTAGSGLTIQGGAGGTGASVDSGGDLKLQGGAGGGTNGNGGNAYLFGGAKNASGTNGNVILAHNGTSAIGNVGIGTAAPTRTLHVVSNNVALASPNLLLEQANAGGDSSIEVKNTANGQSFYVGLDSSTNNFSINSAGAAGTPTTIAHVQSTSNVVLSGTPASIAATYGSNVTAGNFLVAAVVWDTAGATVNSVTCSDTRGNVWTGLPIKADLAKGDSMEICYAPSTATGADTVTATFNGNAGIPQMLTIHEYSGVSSVGPVDVTATNISAGATGTDAVTSTVATPTQNGDLIFSSVYNDDSGPSTVAAGTGFNQRATGLNLGNTFMMSEDKIQTTGAAIAGTFTFGTARNYIAYMVAFKPNTTITDTYANSLFTLSAGGATTFKNSVNTSAAFQVQNAAGTSFLGVDTAGATVNLGVVGSVATASTVNIATSTGATQTVNIGAVSAGAAAAGTAVSIQGGTGASAVVIGTNGAGNINVDTGTTGSILIGGGTSGNPAKTISIGPTGTNTNTTTYNLGVNTAGTQLIRLGSTTTGAAAGTLINIQGGSTANTAITLGTNTTGGITIDTGTTGSINIGNGASSKTVTVGSTNGSSSTILQAGSGNVIAKVGTDSATSFQVQNAFGATQLSLDTTNTTTSLNLINNGGAETGSPPTNWTAQGTGSSVATGTGTDAASGVQSAKVTFGTSANAGVKVTFASAPTASTTVNYVVSFSIKQVSGTAAAMGNVSPAIQVLYSPDNGTTLTATCSNYSSGSTNLSTSVWTKVSCTFIPGSTTVTTALLIIRQLDAPGVSRVIDIDNLSVVQQNSSGTQNVGTLRLGGAQSQGLTLLTLDTYAGTPFTGTNATLAGSMYYDTTALKIQCYDGSAWGACGAAPNSIVTLTPEYAGAVLNGVTPNNVGTMTSDFCATSGALTVGTLCGSGDARNFYKWTSPQTGALNEYDIYVTYKLPTTFKAFASDTTMTLTARTDNTTNGIVTLEVYKAVTGGSPSITACGTETDITTSGGANVWSTVAGNGTETTCGFVGGNNVIFKIRAKAKSNANVYIENLNFTYTNQ